MESQQTAKTAWKRIEAIGGHGVWEQEICVVSLANSRVTDKDLALFKDFPFVQTLDLSETEIGDDGLEQLVRLPALESLVVINTKISVAGLEKFQQRYPGVTVTSKPIPKESINPFTGKPF